MDRDAVAGVQFAIFVHERGDAIAAITELWDMLSDVEGKFFWAFISATSY